jgi:hypothetical protein
MFQRKPRRFSRRRPNNGRGHTSHSNGHMQQRPGSSSFSNGQTRGNFRPTQSAEKLLEKYNLLAKEAMSSGDKTLCENYLQHADHFMRIVEEKNKNRAQFKSNEVSKPISDNKELTSDNKELTKDKIEDQQEEIKDK